MLKLLIVCFVFLSSMCFPQVSPVSKLLSADGFLEVCGLGDKQFSKEQIATMKSAPPAQAMDALKKALDDRFAEEAMCIGYVAGLLANRANPSAKRRRRADITKGL